MSSLAVGIGNSPVTGADAFSVWLAEHHLPGHLPGMAALLVSAMSNDVGQLNPAQRGSLVVLPINPGELGDTARLNFIDDVFETVYLHGLARATERSKVLIEARRLLRASGQIVLAAEAGDFAFAPLPPGGAEHLLRRALADAGFTKPETIYHANGLLIVAAKKNQ